MEYFHCLTAWELKALSLQSLNCWVSLLLTTYKRCYEFTKPTSMRIHIYRTFHSRKDPNKLSWWNSIQQFWHSWLDWECNLPTVKRKEFRTTNMDILSLEADPFCTSWAWCLVSEQSDITVFTNVDCHGVRFQKSSPQAVIENCDSLNGPVHPPRYALLFFCYRFLLKKHGVRMRWVWINHTYFHLSDWKFHRLVSFHHVTLWKFLLFL